MPDYLTTQERQLIAEALAAGKVTICPPRTYSEDLAKPIPFQVLTERSMAQRNRAIALRRAEVKSGERQTDYHRVGPAASRRNAIVRLADGTRSIQAILDALLAEGYECNFEVVRKDIFRLRQFGEEVKIKRVIEERRRRMNENLDKVRALKGKVTAREISNITGINLKTVRNYIVQINKLDKGSQ